jgi:malonate-semialdehyde dehydrogenase (acetylating)/methylmalonate-semialdehyde dehydrogenase
MNNSRFANGSVIYTQNGYYARTFAKETHGAWSASTWASRSPGHFRVHRPQAVLFRRSARDGQGRLHLLHGEQVRDQHLFSEEENGGPCKVDTWDGTINSLPPQH